jgi:signal transduction histidine kinase
VTIRLRLVTAGVLVAGLALLLFGLVLDRLVTTATPRDLDRRLADVADRAVASIGRADPAALATGEPLVLGDPGQDPDPFVIVVTSGGTVLQATARPDEVLAAIPDVLLERTAATVTTESGLEVRLQIRRWQRSDIGQEGVVLAGRATRFSRADVIGFRAFLVVAGVIALIAAATATWFVSGRALRPLRRLAETTDEIGGTGDVSRRLPPVSSDDAVGRLTTSFNAMMDRLGAAQSRLSENAEAQQRFLADASHELRSPLTTIRSNAGFLLERPDAAESDRREALADIAAEGDRMGVLVDGLLALVRTDAGPPPPREPVDLARIVEDAARRARQSGVEVRFDPGAPVVVEGDEEALARLVRILLDNAAVHGEGTVRVTLRRSEGLIRLDVIDHGPGIPEPDLEQIFDRFHRVSGAQHEGGAGLGLAIARSIVDAHRGSIRAENRAERGAAFVVELPPAPVAPPRPD